MTTYNIYHNGKYYDDIYYNGHFIDQVYIGKELVWEKVSLHKLERMFGFSETGAWNYISLNAGESFYGVQPGGGLVTVFVRDCVYGESGIYMNSFLTIIDTTDAKGWAMGRSVVAQYPDVRARIASGSVAVHASYEKKSNVGTLATMIEPIRSDGYGQCMTYYDSVGPAFSRFTLSLDAVTAVGDYVFLKYGLRRFAGQIYSQYKYYMSFTENYEQGQRIRHVYDGELPITNESIQYKGILYVIEDDTVYMSEDGFKVTGTVNMAETGYDVSGKMPYVVNGYMVVGREVFKEEMKHVATLPQDEPVYHDGRNYYMRPSVEGRTVSTEMSGDLNAWKKISIQVDDEKIQDINFLSITNRHMIFYEVISPHKDENGDIKSYLIFYKLRIPFL